MHLTNLFNYKFLVQNIKKSKALIILLMALVPMFTSILLLSAGDNYALSFPEVSLVNIIGMYIIPVILSITLFNYVYKKNSVDFIGSMPISRRTIFMTNTIGGIAIIVLMQLLTMICTLLLSKILTNLVIFGSMIWDIFVYYTIAYIFVFVASNLAMTFSGNKLAQLVAVCLILFLIPFLMMSGNLFGDRYSYINIDEEINNSLNSESEKIIIDGPFHFTAPASIFDLVVDDSDIYQYNTESVVKMLFLSMIYIVIGLIIFNRKKLELAGESYENIKIHLIIKMLTFVPFMFVFCTLDDSDRRGVFLFFIAILAVYYFVFDLITNKKVKLKMSIVSFAVSAIVVFAIYEGIIPKFGRNNIDIVNVDEIQNITLKSINNRYNSESVFELLIEDEEIIDMIVSESLGIVYNSSYYGVDIETYEVSMKEVTALENAADISTNEIRDIEMLNDVKKYKNSNAKILIKMKNGKTHEYTRYLDEHVYRAILTKYGTQKNENTFKNAIPLLEGINMTKEEKLEIIELLNNELTNLTYQELYDLYNSSNTEYTLTVCTYQNHELVKNNFSYKGFKTIYEKLINICNNHAIENEGKGARYNLYNNTSFIKVFDAKNPNLFDEQNVIYVEDEEAFEKIGYKVTKSELIRELFYYRDEIDQFMKSEKGKAVDINQEMTVITSYVPTYFYTNNIEELYTVLAKAYNKYSDGNIKLNVEY